MATPNFNLALETGRGNPFSMADVCAIYGQSKQAIQRRMRNHDIPSCFRIGKTPFWTREAIRKDVKKLMELCK